MRDALGERSEPRATGLTSSAGSMLRFVDGVWCGAVLATVGDRPGLLSFLFHAVSADRRTDAIDSVVDPTQTLTTDSVARFVRYFRRHGYRFVSPAQIRAGLDPDGRYVLMTFDDGYYNNYRMLPILRGEDVPAVFFISTNHVIHGKAFWWDVVYRERIKQGVSPVIIEREQRSLKSRTHQNIEKYLIQEFGVAALDPIGDEDRPMSSDELRTFARSPGVHIGNHTMDHAILTNYSNSEVRRQIEGAQDALEAVLGIQVTAISYPNGNYSSTILRIARECGVHIGITVDPRRSVAPFDDSERLRLGRFCFTRGYDRPQSFRAFRSGWSFRTLAKQAEATIRRSRE